MSVNLNMVDLEKSLNDSLMIEETPRHKSINYGTFEPVLSEIAPEDENEIVVKRIAPEAPAKKKERVLKKGELSNIHEVYKLIKILSLVSVMCASCCMGLIFGNFHLSHKKWWLYLILAMCICLVGSLTIFTICINKQAYPALLDCAGAREDVPTVDNEEAEGQDQEPDHSKSKDVFLLILTGLTTILMFICSCYLFKLVGIG